MRQLLVSEPVLLLQEEGLSLELSSRDPYEQVSQQLAAALKPPLDDPLKLRFTQQHNYSQQPKSTPLHHPGQQEFLLPDMLTQFNTPSDTLFYEVLELPLPELERLKTLKVMLSAQWSTDSPSNCALQFAQCRTEIHNSDAVQAPLHHGALSITKLLF